MNKIIVGIDESKRGTLAGNVYASAVVLGDIEIKGLRDSKKLTHKQRVELYEIIMNNAEACTIGYATVEEITKLNILQASFLAMKRALEQIKIYYNYVIVDGNKYPFKDFQGEAIIKADGKIPEVMSASIIAKVVSDMYIIQEGKKYLEYQFDKHKGYGTKLHKEMIKKFGPSPIHRKTFKGVKEYVIKESY